MPTRFTSAKQTTKSKRQRAGKALEPPAKATPKGGASGAAVPSDEPQQPANAEDKGKGKGFGDGSGDAAVGAGRNEAAALATPKENASGVAASGLKPEHTVQPAADKRNAICATGDEPPPKTKDVSANGAPDDEPTQLAICRMCGEQCTLKSVRARGHGTWQCVQCNTTFAQLHRIGADLTDAPQDFFAAARGKGMHETQELWQQ